MVISKVTSNYLFSLVFSNYILIHKSSFLIASQNIIMCTGRRLFNLKRKERLVYNEVTHLHLYDMWCMCYMHSVC